MPRTCEPYLRANVPWAGHTLGALSDCVHRGVVRSPLMTSLSLFLFNSVHGGGAAVSRCDLKRGRKRRI